MNNDKVGVWMSWKEIDLEMFAALGRNICTFIFSIESFKYFSNIFLQTYASNSLAITEEYISTFKPSGFARTFGRALNNQQCGGSHLCCPGTIHWAPPQHPFNCAFSKGDFWTWDHSYALIFVCTLSPKRQTMVSCQATCCVLWCVPVIHCDDERQDLSIEVGSQADVADLTLQVTMSGNTITKTETEIKQLGIYQKTNNVVDTIDAYLFIPLTGVETGNIGSVVFQMN